jgi:hypothetical protein
MTNFLAKIAASGARTGAETPIRPPVSGPPLMPGTLPDSVPSAGIDRIETLTAAPASLASPVSPAGANRPINLERANAAPPAAIIPPVNAGQAAAPEPVARPARFDQAQPDRLGPDRSAQPEPVRHQEQPTINEPPLRALSRRLAPEAGPVIQAPKALRPPEPVPEAPRVAHAVSATAAAQPRLDAAAASQPIRAESKNHAPDPAPIKQPPAALEGITNPGERTPTPALLPLPAMLPAEPAVAAPQVVGPPPRKEARISIGRLDVQVNNHPPAPPPVRPAAPVTHPAPDTLERHYLDRFRLKP